jgi:uncharacterized protein YcbX
MRGLSQSRRAAVKRTRLTAAARVAPVERGALEGRAMDGERLGTVMQVTRFPVKSMRGETLPEAWVGPHGLVGDRAFALRDARDGRIMSAKRTASLLGLAARYVEGPGSPASITLADGGRLRTDDPEAAAALSRALGRAVRLCGPEDTDADRRTEWDDDTSFDAPPFAFVDLAPLHLLTTASLRALAALYPAGRVDPRRFRPNLLVDCGPRVDFVEDALVGRLLAVGERMRLRIFMPTIRCVMTTVAQEDLPKDPGILRAAVERHDGNLGAYATVEAEGPVRVGDPVVALDG